MFVNWYFIYELTMKEIYANLIVWNQNSHVTMILKVVLVAYVCYIIYLKGESQMYIWLKCFRQCLLTTDWDITNHQGFSVLYILNNVYSYYNFLGFFFQIDLFRTFKVHLNLKYGRQSSLFNDGKDKSECKFWWITYPCVSI